MKTVTEAFGKENSWTFGNCNSSMVYNSYDTLIEICCQPQGTYELACKDSNGDGWHGGYIEMGGMKYCKNFNAGGEENHDVSISGIFNFTDEFSSTNNNTPLSKFLLDAI